MNKKMAEALNEISDRHIDEAAKAGKRRIFRWAGAVAAILAVVLLFNAITPPIAAKAVSLADYSDPNSRNNYEVTTEAVQALYGFFESSMNRVLAGDEGENQAFSPINLYMALSAVAELSGGDEQVMAALNAPDLTVLRRRTAALWNSSSWDKGNQSLLANSIWLDKELTYNQAVMDTLARDHYTSVYQGDLGSRQTNRDIRNWLNNQTGRLLKDSTEGIGLDPDTVFALYSTIYYQAKWQEEFRSSANKDGVFHAPGGDVDCTYMNKKKLQGFYYWGTDFGAISLGLKDDCRMWLILPDEDKTVADVLAAGDYAKMALGSIPWEDSKGMYINLSLPKFDIRDGGNLQKDLQVLGITNVFQPGQADFSGAMPGFRDPIWLDSVNQATRVAIDEKGVTAASYIEIPGAGAAEPPTEIIDFVLDRPFIFVITTGYRVPLFAGVVNEP